MNLLDYNNYSFAVILSSYIAFMLMTPLIIGFVLNRKGPGSKLLGFELREEHLMTVPIWFRLVMALFLVSVAVLVVVFEKGIIITIIAGFIIWIAIRIVYPK